MDDEKVASPASYLTKTEAFVVACRERGMSDTAIRRLLQLSASEAVALGVIPAHASEFPVSEDAPIQGPATTSWPQIAGRLRPFPRRRRSRTQALRRPYADRGGTKPASKLSKQEEPIRKESNENRGENV